MKTSSFLPLFVSLAAIVVAVVLHLSGNSAIERAHAETSRLNDRVRRLSDSLLTARRTLDSLEAIAPGLGEFMTGIQLHTAKLYYAGRASNWGLAGFEVNELREAMEGAEALQAVRNGVKTAPVIAAVRQAQVAAVESAVEDGNRVHFDKSYGDLLDACNDCHRTSGYPFLRIVLPSAPPVTNQLWSPPPRRE